MAARRMILACRVFSALRFSATDSAIVVAAQKFVVGPTMRSGAPRSRLCSSWTRTAPDDLEP